MRKQILAATILLIGLAAAFPALAWNAPGFSGFSDSDAGTSADESSGGTSKNLEYERTHQSSAPHTVKSHAKSHKTTHGKKHTHRRKHKKHHRA